MVDRCAGIVGTAVKFLCHQGFLTEQLLADRRIPFGAGPLAGAHALDVHAVLVKCE
jgi:hypothetical protein